MDPLWIVAIGVVVVLGGVLVVRLHAFLALVLGATAVAALTPQSALEQYARQRVAKQEMTPKAAEKFVQRATGERVTTAFGDTCAQIGILIAMASLVGKCLLDSGSADRIVRSSLKLFGEARAGLAFVSSGFLLGIPVFFDTVFYLMMPLGKAMRMRTGHSYLLYVLTITAGASMAHSLVPPTPGPLAVAAELNVDIGLMMVGGTVVGLFTVVFGYLYARFLNRVWSIPLRPSADLSLEQLEELSRRDDSQLPPLGLALAPIVLPVVLIAGNTGLKMWFKDVPFEQITDAQQALLHWAGNLGNSTIALTIAAAVALVTLAWQCRSSRAELAKAVQVALVAGGEIILITAAGGAFGGVLGQTGIAERIQQLAPASPAAIIPLAFLVTTAIRTAQGSATVAMLTAVGIVAPLVASGQAGCHPLYVALAIGCGSKPIAWMNDSGFWVICKMSGLSVEETLRAVTPMTATMGVIGLLVTMAGAMLFPLN